MRIAFHTHGQGGDSNFDKALAASPYTALNLDVGHYFGVNGKSPVPVIQKYHDRIASLHLKDRKAPAPAVDGKPAAGPNMPWGQGGTPLKEILQLLKKHKYPIPGSIEYEYETPAGSDVLTEVKKCVQYCKAALA
jgi:sugar phosphate isomerase/epimerase